MPFLKEKSSTPDIIRETVLSKLGSPNDLYKLEIKQITPTNYRINIVCVSQNKDAIFKSFTRPYSYHAHCEETGEITFNPPIKRIS
jgi:hypothetical protein